jgi:hypothetical protein
LIKCQMVSRDDTAYDTDFAMYYSLFIKERY